MKPMNRPDAAHRGAPRRRRRDWLLIVAATTAAGVGVALLVIAATGVGSGSTSETSEVAGLDPGTLPPPATIQAMHSVSDVGLRFVARSAGLDVPLGELTMVDGNITPPGITSAYMIRNLGVPLSEATTGTVFVVMHSCRNACHAPGDWLTNRAAGTPSLADGDLITVGELTYRVTGWRKYPKASIGTQSDVWAPKPGRLVVITCLELPTGEEPVDNLVINAQLVENPRTTFQRAA